jgi:hypothetical protein
MNSRSVFALLLIVTLPIGAFSATSAKAPKAELHAADYCTRCDPTTNPAARTYKGEEAWNETDELGSGATGGGFSVLYRLPFYQLGTVPFTRKGGASLTCRTTLPF